MADSISFPISRDVNASKNWLCVSFCVIVGYVEYPNPNKKLSFYVSLTMNNEVYSRKDDGCLCL